MFIFLYSGPFFVWHNLYFGFVSNFIRIYIAIHKFVSITTGWYFILCFIQIQTKDLFKRIPALTFVLMWLR